VKNLKVSSIIFALYVGELAIWAFSEINHLCTLHGPFLHLGTRMGLTTLVSGVLIAVVHQIKRPKPE